MEKKIISSSILPKLSSNHKPIMLQLDDEDHLGPIPFRFSPRWIDRDGFLNTITKAWSIPITRSPNYVWERKLKNTKSVLKEWVKHSLKNSISDRKEALEKLEEIQLEIEEKDITSAMLEKEQKA